MKKIKTKRVYPSDGFEVIYKCPYCKNDSLIDMQKSKGKEKILCEICNWHFILKWKFKG